MLQCLNNESKLICKHLVRKEKWYLQVKNHVPCYDHTILVREKTERDVTSELYHLIHYLLGPLESNVEFCEFCVPWTNPSVV